MNLWKWEEWEKAHEEKLSRERFTQRSAWWICQGVLWASTCLSRTRESSLTRRWRGYKCWTHTLIKLSPCVFSLRLPVIHTNQLHLGKKTFSSSSCELVCAVRKCVGGWVGRENWQGGRANMLGMSMNPECAHKCLLKYIAPIAGFLSKGHRYASHGHFHPSLSARKRDYLLQCKEGKNREWEGLFETKENWMEGHIFVSFKVEQTFEFCTLLWSGIKSKMILKKIKGHFWS